MKPISLQFFTPQDNTQPDQKGTAKPIRKTLLTGSVSTTGKLVLPLRTVQKLSIDSATDRFKVGIEQGKRKIKSLYLIPANQDQDSSDSFELIKKANSYSITLALILQRGGVDYKKTAYVFTIYPFEHEVGVTSYELRLFTQPPKPPYTGKLRGRRTKKVLQTQS